jgi:Flp pilus assembly protein TadB
MRRRTRDDSLRITSASGPRSEDIRGREKRYLVSMGIRTLCFLLAVAFMGHWVMWVFLAGSIFLPYFAVVIANAGNNMAPGASAFEYRPDLPALEGRPVVRTDPQE